LVQRDGRPCAANFVRELLEEIDKLAQYVQLSEFTEHGLPHLASLVERIETWRRFDGTYLLSSLNADEVFLLLFAVLGHDIGMLCQREEDLQDVDRVKYARVFADLPTWIRRTHVPRLEGVISRLMGARYPEFVSSRLFHLGCALARSHQYWPGESGFQQLEEQAIRAGFDPHRMKALAGVLAVADLLDEDSARCDSMTLFANKAGNLMNRAHWLRHLLTSERLRIRDGVVKVQIVVPKNLQGKINSSLVGLRNHVKLAEAYDGVLATIRAEVRVEFPDIIVSDDEVPSEPPLELLLFQPDVHVLRTLLGEALPEATETEPSGTPVEVLGVTLNRVDRRVLDFALGPIAAESGRSDLEVTYAAASLRGEQERLRALSLLRQAAIEADSRGDIKVVRRLSGLVLQDLVDHSRPLTGALWAVAYVLHWATHKQELYSVDRYLGMCSGEEKGKKSPPTALPTLWRVVALTVRALLRQQSFTGRDLVDLVNSRLEFPAAPLEPEEQIAWHDLFEALWGTDQLSQDAPVEFLSSFSRLREFETASLPPFKRLLADLAWRMSVQSECLRGFGRWEGPSGSTDRVQYQLLPDRGRESLRDVWKAWFADASRDTLKDAARQARKTNPPGSEFYLAALEVDDLAAHVDIQAAVSDDDRVHRQQEYRDATSQDEAHRLIHSTVSSLLNASLNPSNASKYPLPATILGERLALRRWYLSSWHEVVGYSVQTMLAHAHTLHLQGEQVVAPVLRSIQHLPWGLPYVGNSLDLLKTLLPQVEARLTVDDLAPVFKAISESPQRIANVRHPGLQNLGDALTSDILELLASWTLRELENTAHAYWPATFRVWTEILRYVPLTSEFWQQLSPLFDHALSRLSQVGDFSDIIGAMLARAPWPMVRSSMEQITMRLSVTENRDWIDGAKTTVVNGLLNREGHDWSGSQEHHNLMTALKKILPLNNDPNDRTLLEFLSQPVPAEGYERVAERWLELLEEIKGRVAARSAREYSIYGDEYTVGKSRSINEETAVRAGKALEELWNAPYATWYEIRTATHLGSLLFEASCGLGAKALARALMKAMESRRTAATLGDTASCTDTAWEFAAQQSERFPQDEIPNVVHLLVQRLFEVPVKAAWAQARFATEVLLRSTDLASQQRAQYVLLAVRARTTHEPRYSANALVASVDRILEKPNWSPMVQEVLHLIVEWVEEAAGAPAPGVRETVATICHKLARRLSGEQGQRLAGSLDRLKRDVRMRVRLAAGG
jgi:hypothetical protein